MDFTRPIHSDHPLTWEKAADVLRGEEVAKGTEGTWSTKEVTALIQSSPLVADAYQTAKELRDEAKKAQKEEGLAEDRVIKLKTDEIRGEKVMTVAAGALFRKVEKEKVGRLTFGRRRLSAKKFALMTSRKRWFHQRLATRLKLLWKGYGLYLRTSDIALSATLRQRINLLSEDVPKSMQTRFTTLQTSLQKLPTLTDSKGEIAKIVNPFKILYVIERNLVDELKALLKQDPGLVDRRLPIGQGPLEFACKKRKDQVVIALLEANADVDQRTQRGATLSDLIRLNNIDVDQKYLKPIDSLVTAMMLDNVEAFETLAKDEQKRNATDSQGNTPLHVAMERNKIGMAKALIDAGADLFAENCEGMIPLNKLFCYGAYYGTVANLMHQKASYTSLHQTIALGDVTALENLITKENIDTPNAKGFPPLHYALLTQQHQCVNTLLQHNPNLLATDARGLISLFYDPRDPRLDPNSIPPSNRMDEIDDAVQQNDLEKAKKLLQSEADIYSPNNKKGSSLFQRYLCLPEELQKAFPELKGDPKEFQQAIATFDVNKVTELLQKEPKLATILQQGPYGGEESMFSAVSMRQWSNTNKAEAIMFALLNAGCFFNLEDIPRQNNAKIKAKMEEMRDQGTFSPFPLFEAIGGPYSYQVSDTDLIAIFAQNQTFLNQLNPNGMTPLQFTLRGREDVKKTLQHHQDDHYKQRLQQLTEVAKILLAKDVNVSQVDVNSCRKDAELIKLILARKPKLSNSEISFSLLRFWIEQKDKEITKQILELKPTLVERRKIEELIKANFDEETRDELAPLLKACLPTSYPAAPEIGKPLIYQAIDTGDVEVINAVMALKPPQELLPLHYALSQHANNSVIETLVACGCPLDAKDEKGNTPLHLLPENHNLIPFFLKHKAPINEANRFGQIPTINPICIITSLDLDPNQQSSDGCRPLDLLLLLLASSDQPQGSATPEERRAYQEFVLSLDPHNFNPSRYFLTQLLLQLLERGANPNLSCSALGRTTLSLAKQHRRAIGSDVYSALLHAARYNQS